jgi:hypothetical protein
MTAHRGPITSQTPTSPHLSRPVWRGEQLTEAAEQLAELFRDERVLADLTAEEFAAARTCSEVTFTSGV